MNSLEPLMVHRPNPTRTSLLHRACASDLGPPPVHDCRSQNAPFWCDHVFHSNQSTQFMRQDLAAKQQCYAAWERQLKSPYYQSQLKFEFQERQSPKRVSDFVGCENRRFVRTLGPCQTPWLPSPPPQQPSAATVRNVFPAGSVPKRSCAGTGVFLPRKYTNPSDSHKKSGLPNVVLPSKVVNPQIPNFDAVNVKSQACLSGGFSNYDYECLMARRNAILAQQRSLRQVGGGCLNKDMPLPQEWLY